MHRIVVALLVALSLCTIPASAVPQNKTWKEVAVEHMAKTKPTPPAYGPRTYPIGSWERSCSARKTIDAPDGWASDYRLLYTCKNCDSGWTALEFDISQCKQMVACNSCGVMKCGEC